LGPALTAALVGALAAGCFERGGGTRRAAQDGGAPAPAALVLPSTAGVARPVGTPQPAGHVAVRLEAEPAHLNPLLVGDSVAVAVTLGGVYEGLLEAGALGEPVRPCLAEQVEVSADQTEWTFRLRDQVRWHDGRSFAAQDVVFSFGLVRGSTRALTPLAADFDDLTEVARLDDRTVRLSFTGFRVGRGEAIARVPILPRHVFFAIDPLALAGAAASRRPVGTGPLRFVDWAQGEAIVLARHPGYWGQPAGAALVTYRIVASRERALAALADGTLDVLLQVPVDEALAAAAAGQGRLVAYDAPAYLAVALNLRRPGLGDVRVRRALAMLLDRDAIIEQVFRGHARVVSGPYLPDSSSTDPSVTPVPFDPTAAAALLAEAGATGARRPTLRVLVPDGSRSAARIADIWAADAKPLARLEPERVPFTEVLARARAGRFDAALLSFSTDSDVDLYARFHSSQHGQENYGAVADAALDAALEAIRATPEESARRAEERRVHRRLHELLPYLFIASDRRVGLLGARVGGFAMTATGVDAAALWVTR
jgi:peptide/nickel transport system substrate-binding protein